MRWKEDRTRQRKREMITGSVDERRDGWDSRGRKRNRDRDEGEGGKREEK